MQQPVHGTNGNRIIAADQRVKGSIPGEKFSDCVVPAFEGKGASKGVVLTEGDTVFFQRVAISEHADSTGVIRNIEPKE